MQAVLWDVLRSGEVVAYYKQRDTSLNVSAKQIELLDTIFSIHNITKEDFRRSLKFYQSHPQLLQVILDSLQRQASPISNTRIE